MEDKIIIHESRVYVIKNIINIPMGLQEVIRKYEDDTLRDKTNQYYTVHEDISPVMERVSIISKELLIKIQESYPELNLELITIPNLETITIPNKSLKGESSNKKYSEILKENGHYHITDDVFLSEAFVPMYESASKFLVAERVQYYDVVNKTLYNLMCSFTSGAYVYVNSCSDHLDQQVIDIANTSHNLKLMRAK